MIALLAFILFLGDTLTDDLATVQVDADGFATQSQTIALGDGPYVLKKPWTYKGQPGISLHIIGNRRTKIIVEGDVATAIRFEGAYKSGLRDLEIVNRSEKCKQVVWFDAINADEPNTRNAGSHGCYLEGVTIRSQAGEPALLAIGHLHLTKTSQVSELRFANLLLHGKGGQGIGVDIRQGGNTKHFSFDNLGITHCRIGVNWPYASGPLLGRDWSIGACSECDIVQGGSGVLHIVGLNCEQSNQMLRQSGGTGWMAATIEGCEWSGMSKTLRPGLIGLVAVQAHGAVAIRQAFFKANNGVPIIAATFPHDPGVPTSIDLCQVAFNDGVNGKPFFAWQNLARSDTKDWALTQDHIVVAGRKVK